MPGNEQEGWIFLNESALNKAEFKSEQSLVPFVVKTLLMILPAVILALITDSVMLSFQTKTGSSAITCVLIQTSILILTMYSLGKGVPSATKEFQTTLAGVFFISLYFGLQENYYSNIQTTFKDLRKVMSL